ncbi:hypothetical protein FHS95_000137 [Sphingomonas naasensis]|uniref:Phage tail protein n=1 Tax=Sphingomonas naasensis TaxID=1344951 RepID=A0A4S1WQV9_9SPHN|nr:hypothetical protein [Sphingomonas naasensis]TGX45729.1 phage tail protein [Sphingomonas naasensis]
MATAGTLTLRRTDDDKLREHSERRYKSMMPASDLAAEWYEIAGLCMPQRSRQLVELHKQKQRNATANTRLHDGHAIRSFDILANGMLSGLSSRSRPWRKSKLEDEDLMEYHPVQVWLDAYDQLVNSALGSSNFYEAMLSCYREMSGFGTGAVVIQQHDAASPKFVCHPLTVGEYGIAVGRDLRPDSLCRSFSFDTRQIVENYVADRFDSAVLHWERVPFRVKEAWDKGNYDHRFVVRHLIEPNPAYVPGKLGKVGMPFRSIKWLESEEDKKKFLCIEGYRDQPFMAPRWETIAGEIWGTGRGKVALPDLRALQLSGKRSGEAEDMLVKPPTWGPPAIDRVGMLPGNHTTVAAADMSVGIKPVYEIGYQAVSAVEAKLLRRQQAVDRMAYVDLFMAITTMEGVQPRNIEELARRHEEQLTQLGPVTDRANGELLEVANDRVGGILAARGDLLNLLPEPPEELQGQRSRPTSCRY